MTRIAQKRRIGYAALVMTWALALGSAHAERLPCPANALLSTLPSEETYLKLVSRQEQGEQGGWSQVPRPGIARASESGRFTVVQGSGRFEKTRPEEYLDLFVIENSKLPEGSIVLERQISSALVRAANLLSSRGQTGSNPTLIDFVLGAISQDHPESRFLRVLILRKSVDAPMSKVLSDLSRLIPEIKAKLGDPSFEKWKRSVDFDSLSPNEQFEAIQRLESNFESP